MNAPNKPAPKQVVGKRRHRSHVQERGNQRRQQLLDAAYELLGEIAIEELTFKQMADRAGVPEGSAYHFYANKYDLLRALADELSTRFIDAQQQLIDPKTISSWHDLADLIVSRGAAVYQSNPAAVQICLGVKTPPEIKLEDRINDRAVSAVIEALFDQFFVLPDLPKKHDIFFYVIELVDLIFSLSVAENGSITPEMIEEAKRVARGYLGTYLASVLEKRGAKTPAAV